jgi:hypothetical protein
LLWFLFSGEFRLYSLKAKKLDLSAGLIKDPIFGFVSSSISGASFIINFP